MTTPLFSGGIDWVAIGWSALLSALTSWSNMRIRMREAAIDGEPPPTIADVIADTLIGTTAGVVLATIVPEQFPHLHTFGGITGLSCIGGVGGRRVYDLGLSILEYLVRLRLGVKPEDIAAKENDDEHGKKPV